MNYSRAEPRSPFQIPIKKCNTPAAVLQQNSAFPMQRILILGGTSLACNLAEALIDQSFAVTTSLAGRTQNPRLPTGVVRVGGFGGVTGLVDYVQQAAIAAVVDATHPFAAQMSHQAAVAAQSCGIPRLLLVSPPWEAQTGDRWLSVPSLAAAAALIPSVAQRIFLTIGRQELATFAHLSDRWFLMRLLEAPPAALPLPPGTVIYERPPFTLSQERAWMQQYQIDAVVSKNSGGSSTYAKLEAARELGLPVVMVERPELPEGDRVSTVEDAVCWVQQQLPCAGCSSTGKTETTLPPFLYGSNGTLP